MQVEHIAGVGLATRRAAQQQRHCPIRLCLLGQVVEDDEDVLALVHPVLSDGRAGVGGDVLEAGGVGCRGIHDHRVLHGAGLAQILMHLGDGGVLLADRDVDAAHLLLRVAAAPVVELVDDRVGGDGGLAGLAVTNDQLSLTASDRDHRVDGLEAGHQNR